MDIYIDLDGPILDVSEKYYAVYRYILGKTAPNILSKDAYWEMKKNRVPSEEIFKESGVELSQEISLHRWKQLIETPEFLKYDIMWPWVPDVLKTLYNNYSLILITLRNSYENLIDELRDFEILDFFKTILTEKDNGGSLYTKKRLLENYPEFIPVSSIIVGDTEVDILAGKELNIKTIAVLSGIRNRELLESLCPDFIIDNISSLPSITKQIE
ncbi:MAG: HAD hydrolase-like protein [bacterium]